MTANFQPWDYLIVTASDEAKAAAYADQLALRRQLKLLGDVHHALVVTDPEGRRVGSGGSTIGSLIEVLAHEIAAGRAKLNSAHSWLECLRELRILIVHGGGESQRLPAYGPWGKLFLPLPGESDSALAATLFDRQLPVWLRLPPQSPGAGQIVVTAGDVLLEFAPGEIALDSEGITGLACKAAPGYAQKHGVYCASSSGQVRRFLQKPSPEEQERHAVVDGYGRVTLDMGVFSFDADTALRLLRLCQVMPAGDGRLSWSGPIGEAIRSGGLNFYREICCALGSENSLDAYLAAVRSAGSPWNDAPLRQVFEVVAPIPCRVQVLRDCRFLHFGSTREILVSGLQAKPAADPFAQVSHWVNINNRIGPQARCRADHAWVEGCTIAKDLDLPGDNLLVGVDANDDLSLPAGICLDVLPGRGRSGAPTHFIRCYHCDDPWHLADPDSLRLCGMHLAEWLKAAGLSAADIWPAEIAADGRRGWNARLFPAETDEQGFRRWLWMGTPREAVSEQFTAWGKAQRYSFEEMAALADREAFGRRRHEIRLDEVSASFRRYMGEESGFSAADLTHLLDTAADPAAVLAEFLAAAHWYWEHSGGKDASHSFPFARSVHSLGSAVADMCHGDADAIGRCLARLAAILPPTTVLWLEGLGLALPPGRAIADWTRQAHATAFESLRGWICASGTQEGEPPCNSLRSDEIVWGRAPARLDLSGGWTDTPPYTLERGGSVLNAAVLLNTQPPIQAFARVTSEPVLRLRSIDVGSQIEIRSWDELLDCRVSAGEFALPKAAIALSGFAPSASGVRPSESLCDVLTRFGGGIELSTLAAIPKGSGLGTSSIMGSVLVAVIHRVLGRTLTPDELFHAVLRLEQIMTTGGGWQDQIGGSVGGLKLVTTTPGLVPQATIRYVPADLLDPALNGGQTLLYYTGITRLAKNILQQVVGRWLDRDREAAATLERIRALSLEMTEAVARKDLAEFGRLIDVAWRLNKQLDPNSTTPEIEALLARIRPHLYGAKLLGAGGGGFLLLVCKSPADAAAARKLLDASPPNARSRFFDFEVSRQGLAVSVC